MINTELFKFGSVIYIGLITVIIAMIMKKLNNNQKV